jgi:hypothetical protein
MIRPFGRRHAGRPLAAFDYQGAVMSEMGAGGSLDQDEGAEYSPDEGDRDEAAGSRPSGPGTGSPMDTEFSLGSSEAQNSSSGSPGHKRCLHTGCRCEVTYTLTATEVFRFICHPQCEDAKPVVRLADDHTCGCSHTLCIR